MRKLTYVEHNALLVMGHWKTRYEDAWISLGDIVHYQSILYPNQLSRWRMVLVALRNLNLVEDMAQGNWWRLTAAATPYLQQLGFSS